MRAVVCTDLEGVGGVDHYQACFRGWPTEFRRAQELMESEANAVIAGLRDAGLADIVVTDWHFDGNNLRRDRVDAPVEGLWIDGAPTMSAWLDDARRQPLYGERDLAIFVGMHAAAGAAAFMAHTFWQGLAITVDGVAVNEAYLWATMVAAGGARIGFVAGEARVVDECAVLLPGVPVVPVKEAIDRDRARTTRDPRDLAAELRQAAADAARAVSDQPTTRPRFDGRVGAPVRVTFYEQAWADRAARRGLGEPDGERTIATVLAQPDGLIPLAAACTLAMPAGMETRLLTALAPAPERTRLPEAARQFAVTCVHTPTRSLLRRGVRQTQRMDQSRYPTPPGEPGGTHEAPSAPEG